MIERLYIERVADGIYEVTCNSFFTTVCADDVDEAVDVETYRHFDEVDNAEDAAGVRYGFMPFDLIGVAYGGVVRIVPDFQRERVAQRLVEAVAE